jgi:hypothetical protein
MRALGDVLHAFVTSSNENLEWRHIYTNYWDQDRSLTLNLLAEVVCLSIPRIAIPNGKPCHFASTF